METAHEIIRGMSPGLGAEVVGYFREQDRPVYRTTLATLASQRKLRPVFVQRKSSEQQVAWLLDTLRLKTSDQVAEHLLQVWLMKARSGMLKAFLDAAGVEHDGEGAVDELPEELDGERVKAAVDGLLADYPAEEVGVYLRVFQLQQPGGWPAIAAELESRTELRPAGG